MRSPADMKTIQIDITNACNKRCSNCTRFCGNHKKNFFMDFDMFKRAVNSLDGYEGVVGVMGGEPTMHPEFERFVLYAREKLGTEKKENRLIYPQREFIKEVRRRELESHFLMEQDGEKKLRLHGLGLWSNMGSTYRKHYELIQDSFSVQLLNDHINSSYHQPGLVARKDLGISDEEWIQLRDKCWLQNEWSATITPKGAFFCEIAGALDMLFGGPGGWKVEPGWWKRTPEEFGDQLHWCELCGFALDTFMRDAEEEKDDVSPTLYHMLEEIESPRLKAGKTNLIKIQNGVIAEESKAPGRHFSAEQPYIEHYEDRFNANNSVLFVKDFQKIIIPTGEMFGIELNRILKSSVEWILFCQNENADTSMIPKFVQKHVLNPGTMHLGEDFALFNKGALSLREFGYDRVAHTKSFNEILQMWDQKKVIRLEELQELIKWKRKSIVAGKRYVIWGTGYAGSNIAEIIQDSDGNLEFVIDKNAEKNGQEFYGVKTYMPEILVENPDTYDYLVIAHLTKFDEIKKQALGMGIGEDKIIMPYDIL